MNNLTTIEILVVSSLVLQCVLVFISMLVYGHITDQRAWKWFILAQLAIIIRRLIGTIRLSTGYDTLILENGFTVLVTIFFMVYVWVKSITTKNNK